MRNIALGLGLVIIACGWGGCSATNGPPLGGPFGGTTSNNPAPGSAGALSTPDDAGTQSADEAGSDDSGSTCAPVTGIPGAGQGDAAGAPTWSMLYKDYFAAGTVGNCANSACHTEMPSPSVMYTWLQSEQTDCACPNCLASITSTTGSVLSWFGGSMPIAGPTSQAQATSDIQAWFAAGAKNN